MSQKSKITGDTISTWKDDLEMSRNRRHAYLLRLHNRDSVTGAPRSLSEKIQHVINYAGGTKHLEEVPPPHLSYKVHTEETLLQYNLLL